MSRFLTDCFGAPRRGHKQTRPWDEGSRSRESRMSVDSNTSLRTRKKKSRKESVDDIIEKRISELGLPGLEGRRISKKVDTEDMIEEPKTIKRESIQKRVSQMETPEEKLRRARELRKVQRDRKLSQISLISQHGINEDSTLEDLCETTGVESRRNTHLNKLSSQDKLHILSDVSKTLKEEEIKVDEPTLAEAKRARKEARKKRMQEIVLTIFCLN